MQGIIPILSKRFLKEVQMLRILSNFMVLGVCLIFTSDLHAQVLRGRVSDQTTNESLPAATVYIAGTYQGTITNNDGLFAIKVDDLPVDIVVRYVGYRSDTLVATTYDPLEFKLEPVIVEMDQLVITDEDPAVWIMRQVIERKQEWWNDLETFEALAYARMTFSNDTGIVAITESAATAWWDHEKGFREKITGTRRTGNLPFENALPAASFMGNFYNDDIRISGHTLIGVTHPDALNRYAFRLKGTRRVDDAVVYDISVVPKNKLISGFVGNVSVLDEEFAMIEAQLQPGQAFLFPLPIQRYDVVYEQQFSNYGGDIWLPIDLRSNAVVELSFGPLLRIPPVVIDIVSRFTDYQLNEDLPDSLFESDRRSTVDSTAIATGESLSQEGAVVPLTPQEAIAYASIDSTDTLEEAYAPTGLLGPVIREGSSRSGRSSSTGIFSFLSDVGAKPQLWYNRVDAFYGGIELSREFADIVEIKVQGGLNTGQRGGSKSLIKGGLRVEKDWFFDAEYRRENVSTYSSSLRNRLVNSVTMLFAGQDYFDYYRREGIAITTGYQFEWQRARIAATFLTETHSSLSGNVSYDLFGSSNLQRLNPLVPEGQMQTLSMELRLGRQNSLQIGPQRFLSSTIEISLPQSDFIYRRFSFNAGGRIKTFMKRRFLPATLDYGLSVGLASDGGRDLPPQRTFIVEGSLSLYHMGGSLYTRRGLPYRANGVVFGYWEHNFRTLPFELMGLESVARQGLSFIIFGGHAYLRGTQSNRNDWIHHHELGASLSGILGLIRLNLAYQISENKWYPTISIARIF